MGWLKPPTSSVCEFSGDSSDSVSQATAFLFNIGRDADEANKNFGRQRVEFRVVCFVLFFCFLEIVSLLTSVTWF